MQEITGKSMEGKAVYILPSSKTHSWLHWRRKCPLSLTAVPWVINEHLNFRAALRFLHYRRAAGSNMKFIGRCSVKENQWSAASVSDEGFTQDCINADETPLNRPLFKDYGIVSKYILFPFFTSVYHVLPAR